MKTAAEMPACGCRGKPTAGFPPRPQALEIAARFPHFRSRYEQWKSGKANPAFPLSHCGCDAYSSDWKTKTGRPEARSYAPPFRLILRLENAVRAGTVRAGTVRTEKRSITKRFGISARKGSPVKERVIDNPEPPIANESGKALQTWYTVPSCAWITGRPETILSAR